MIPVRLGLFLILVFPPFLWAGDAANPDKKGPATRTVEELAKMARPSLVVIKHTGRDGQQQGLGSGFVVSADGLIATNFHVIGEARPITVQLENGKEYPVKVVHASDRTLDLALLKINAKDLTPLELGDSDRLKEGQAIVVLGHPRGLKNSVVSGILSGRPKVEKQTMLQLAIPIEAGNSGGPVLDRQGKVHGIVTLKSQITPNLGFAMPVNDLKRLLQKPNPIPMSRWVTIGKLNSDEWQTLFGGRWRQRNGLILVDGSGPGFAGRTLCLSQATLPKIPFEVEVTVKLENEKGAAGLVFHSDGNEKHYGFYPSNGQLRLTRFEGPSVFTWKVLHQEASEFYRPGEWNTLKVRVEKDRLQGYVNDQLVVESTDRVLAKGQVGLCMFRNTPTEFKNFRIGKKLLSLSPSPELIAKIGEQLKSLIGENPPSAKLVKDLTEEAPLSVAVLRIKAKELEAQAQKLRELALAVHRNKVLHELKELTHQKDENIDLLRAALLLSKLDNEELNIEVYLKQVDR